VHTQLGDLLTRYDVNDYAASVRVYAVKPKNDRSSSSHEARSDAGAPPHSPELPHQRFRFGVAK
jgi:hypothetical protein